ncbi:unnamed protein product [Linum tenue]|uniref:Uncharacterized protein n=1 Tax=Linum tenue TaxID=586396 RepID=A0AAV0J7B9_9ROSI|nr:unnamed protein product [Linum tenue]
MVATLFCAVPMIINGDFQVDCCLAGIVTSLLVPVRQVSAVIFLREGFNAEKGMALTLCLWGFASHLYGRYRAGSEKQDTDDRNPQQFEHGNGNNLA